MTVWIVRRDDNSYKFTQVVAVFDSEEKAVKYRDDRMEWHDDKPGPLYDWDNSYSVESYQVQ